MKIENCCINGIRNPVGYKMDAISASYRISGNTDCPEPETVIEVSTDAAFGNVLYVKKGKGFRQTGELLEMKTEPRTCYYWRVSLTDGIHTLAESDTASFETGKMNEPWQAEWITTDDCTEHPVFRKEFYTAGNIKKTRLYITGLGLFEAYIDGQRIGCEYLAPYMTDYERKIQVITLMPDDVPAAGGAGRHELTVMLGPGWYSGTFGLEGRDHIYGDRPVLIAELHAESEDGTHEIIKTDGSWTYTASDIESGGIYDGEVLNRLLWDGRENPAKKAVVLEDTDNKGGVRCADKSHLSDRLSIPVTAHESIAVKELIHTPAGETVLDMGQNFAGYVEYDSSLARGTKLVFDFGEILQGGNFYNGNYRGAKSEFVYISDGRRETVRPHFTYFGFRYVRVSGAEDTDPADFTGRAIYSDMTRTGWIKTGNEKVNRLYENTLWGLKSNFVDLPTDCPQRNERLGWCGDAQVFSAAASYHMDTKAFYRKYLDDLKLEQQVCGGGMPDYIPDVHHTGNAGAVWGDAATILPDNLYRFTGDISNAGEYYGLMKRWVDHIDGIDARRGRKYLFDFGASFGDWLALDGVTPESFKGATDDTFTASVYYYNSAELVSRMAKELGFTEDSKRYRVLAGRIREAVLSEFFTPSGRLAVDTQTGCVTALKYGIYRNRQRLASQLKERISKDCNEIKGGFIGAPLLCSTLAENGMSGLAYDFLMNEKYPGWLYEVNMGATTVWERWNSVRPDGTVSQTGMNSLNHYAYGSVIEFVYAWAAGIRPAVPGFTEAVIAPHPDIRLGWLECRYDSAAGTYVSCWKIMNDGHLSIHVQVPYGARAVLKLPEHGDDRSVMLSPGSFDYEYFPLHDLRKPYSENTALSELLSDETASGIMRRYIPEIAGMAGNDKETAAKTLEEIKHMNYLPFVQDRLLSCIAEISGIVVMPAQYDVKNGMRGNKA